MGEINWLAAVLAAVAFFAVGAIWYSLLFGKAWQRALGMSDEQLKAGASMPVIFGLTFLSELVMALVLGHLVAATEPSAHGTMLMAVGLGLCIMVPATAINYLYQRKSLTLFLIDAGHFIAGSAAMGGVFVAFGAAS